MASTVSAALPIGTICLAAQAGPDPKAALEKALEEPIPDGTFFADQAGNVPPQPGVRGITPCGRVNDAAEEVARTPFWSATQRPLRTPPEGLAAVPNGWEYPGYILAWRNHGPVQLVGVVVDSYQPPQPSPEESLVKLGRFLFKVLDKFQRVA